MDRKRTYEELVEKIHVLEKKLSQQDAANSELHESKKKFYALFNQSASAIYLHDYEGNILDVNQAACLQTGFTREELLAMQVFDLHPQNVENQHPPKSEILKKWQDWKLGDCFNFEIMHKRKDGSTFPIELSTCVISYNNQNYIVATVIDITRRKQTKEALEESETRFRMLYERAPISYQSLDGEGRFLEVNQAWLDTLGYEKKEVLGKSFAEFIHPDWQGHFRENFPRFKAVGEILGVEFEMLKKDGTQILVAFNGKIAKDQDGNFIQTHCVLEDISEKRKNEQRIEASERKFRLLTENLPDMIYRMALPSGTYEYVSPASIEIFGYAPEEWYSNPLLIKEIIHPDWHGYFEEQWQELTQGNIPSFYEYQAVDKSGEVKWIHQRNVGHRDENGNIIAIEGVVTDISELKEAQRALEQSENALAESNRDLKMAQRIANVGNWHFDPVTEITLWSDEVYRIYERDPALGPHSITDYEKLYPESYFKHFHSAMSAALHQGTSYDIELKLVLSSNKEKWVNVICEPENESGEKGFKLHGTIQDITERKQLEEKLHLAQKLESIGNLAGGIAHEFNNVLSIIIGNNELIMDDLPQYSLARESSEEIRKAGIRAREIIKQLLTFSRQDTETKKIIDPATIIGESLKLLRATIPTNIAIETDIAENVYAIYGSGTQLNQVIINLCKNSADAIGSEVGKISVSLDNIDEHSTEYAKENASYVRLRVSDTGEGMDETLVKRVFEPYFTTKGIGKGTGIGLAVVHGIVESHDGEIRVESEVSKGTTFTILLPAEGEIGPVESRDFGSLQKGDEHILFIDDEQTICSITKIKLERLGYKVSAYTDPTEALRQFQNASSDFDLVISDMAMPQMTGEQLLSHILHIRSDMPTMICTGYSETLSEKAASNRGIKSFLLKPIEGKELAKEIRRVLDEAKNG